MSVKHPIVAITGSSGAGTSTVTKSFDLVFRRENIKAAIVEGDIEFARQPEEIPMIENVVMHGAAQRSRVVEFLRIDARGRAAGDVADIVCLQLEVTE